jgi:hypothetical protein
MAQTKTVSLTKLQFDHFNGGIFDAEASLICGNPGSASFLTIGGSLSDETTAKIKLLIEQEFASQIGAVAASTPLQREYA